MIGLQPKLSPLMKVVLLHESPLVSISGNDEERIAGSRCPVLYIGIFYENAVPQIPEVLTAVGIFGGLCGRLRGFIILHIR